MLLMQLFLMSGRCSGSEKKKIWCLDRSDRDDGFLDIGFIWMSGQMLTFVMLVLQSRIYGSVAFLLLIFWSKSYFIDFLTGIPEGKLGEIDWKWLSHFLLSQPEQQTSRKGSVIFEFCPNLHSIIRAPLRLEEDRFPFLFFPGTQHKL